MAKKKAETEPWLSGDFVRFHELMAKLRVKPGEVESPKIRRFLSAKEWRTHVEPPDIVNRRQQENAEAYELEGL